MERAERRRRRRQRCAGGAATAWAVAAPSVRAGARHLRRVARQARGQGASVPLVAAQGNAEVASGGGDASVSHAAKRPVTARGVTGLESSQHPTLANDVGAGRLRRGRGKAELAGAPSAGGELPDSCVRAHALPPNHRCIVWLPRLNRSATVGSSTCTLTKCVYLSVVDVACEIQYRRSIAI